MSDLNPFNNLPPETDYVYPQVIVLIVLAILAALLNIGPFLWHAKSRNIPACCMIFWVILLNIISFVNASIWHNDNTNTWWSGNVYCDIVSSVLLAANVGTCGAVLCIFRSLAMVLNTKNTALAASDSQKRKDRIVMAVFCFAFPIYIIAIHYVVAPTRYLLYGVAGCLAITDSSWPSDVLVGIWPLVITLIDAGYAILLIYRMHRYRTEFTRLLTLSSTTKARFLRLFANAIIFVLVLVPLQIVSFVYNHPGGYQRFSWRQIHGPFFQVIFRVPSGGVVPLDRWIYIVMAFLTFMFFGTGADAVGMYRGWLVKVGLLKPGSRSAKMSSFLGSRWGSLGDRAKLLLSKSAGKSAKTSEMESFDSTSLSSSATNHQSPLYPQPSSRHPPAAATTATTRDMV